MTSRRTFLSTSAFVAASSGSFADTSTKYQDLEARLARRDLKDVSKDDLPTPCMVVDLDILESNLKKMADHCHKSGIHLRGHVKVHKSTEIARKQIALGAIGLTCATVA